MRKRKGRAAPRPRVPVGAAAGASGSSAPPGSGILARTLESVSPAFPGSSPPRGRAARNYPRFQRVPLPGLKKRLTAGMRDRSPISQDPGRKTARSTVKSVFGPMWISKHLDTALIPSYFILQDVLPVGTSRNPQPSLSGFESGGTVQFLNFLKGKPRQCYYQ